MIKAMSLTAYSLFACDYMWLAVWF